MISATAFPRRRGRWRGDTGRRWGKVFVDGGDTAPSRPGLPGTTAFIVPCHAHWPGVPTQIRLTGVARLLSIGFQGESMNRWPSGPC